VKYFGEFDIGETAASIREMKLGNKKNPIRVVASEDRGCCLMLMNHNNNKYLIVIIDQTHQNISHIFQKLKH
jgi:hypothetical protein